MQGLEVMAFWLMRGFGEREEYKRIRKERKGDLLRTMDWIHLCIFEKVLVKYVISEV